MYVLTTLSYQGETKQGSQIYTPKVDTITVFVTPEFYLEKDVFFTAPEVNVISIDTLYTK